MKHQPLARRSSPVVTSATPVALRTFRQEREPRGDPEPTRDHYEPIIAPFFPRRRASLPFASNPRLRDRGALFQQAASRPYGRSESRLPRHKPEGDNADKRHGSPTDDEGRRMQQNHAKDRGVRRDPSASKRPEDHNLGAALLLALVYRLRATQPFVRVPAAVFAALVEHALRCFGICSPLSKEPEQGGLVRSDREDLQSLARVLNQVGRDDQELREF